MTDNPQNQLMFRSNCEVAIHVPDLCKAESFYTQVLGFRLVSKNIDGLEFDTGALRLFVNRDYDALYSFIPSLNVSNYQAARNYLIAAGCTSIALRPPLLGVYFQDPFGFVFDIVEHTQNL